MQRKKGDGTFRKLPSGKVEFTVEIGYDIYGKRQRKRFYGKTEKECRKKYAEYLKSGETPRCIAEHTLSSWLDMWLISKKGNVSQATYDVYTGLANHAKHHKIGKIRLSDIKPIHVTEFFGDKSEYSQSFHKRMLFVVRAAFEYAIDNDYCTKNPARNVKPPSKPQSEKEAFTEEEVKTILDFAKADNLFGLAIYIMLKTGIRSQEMRALTIDKFDFNKRVLIIDKAVKRNEKLGLPKNNKTRIIPLNPEVSAYLSQRIAGNAHYILGNSDFVTRSSFRSRYHCFFDRLNKHLADVGESPIDMKSPHSTRHTAATLWQKAGMPVAIVSTLLGHHSVEITGKYTHLNDVDTLAQAVDKYDAIS